MFLSIFIELINKNFIELAGRKKQSLSVILLQTMTLTVKPLCLSSTFFRRKTVIHVSILRKMNDCLF